MSNGSDWNPADELTPKDVEDLKSLLRAGEFEDPLYGYEIRKLREMLYDYEERRREREQKEEKNKRLEDAKVFTRRKVKL